MRFSFLLRLFLALGWSVTCLHTFAESSVSAEVLFQQYCAACHGTDRLGSMGPALLPESLTRIKPAEAIRVVQEGRAATQMPPFAPILTTTQIQSLVSMLYQPTLVSPAWDAPQIRHSRVVHYAPDTLGTKPVFQADPMNIFLVVEGGDHHISVVDGDQFSVIHRFPTRYALHGGPKFTADGRYVFLASRDGWISKFDLWNLKVVSEIRAGLNTRNVAVSPDGNMVAVANYLPHTLVILDGNLELQKVIPVQGEGLDGKPVSSRVSAVYDAGPRKSFVAALKDAQELWEISYDPQAPDIPISAIHDFQYGEGSFIPGFLNPRRTRLHDYLDDFFFTQNYNEVIGASRQAGRGQVINLDSRKKIADLTLPGMPHLGSGITWQWQGKTVMATPNLNQALISIVDMQNWELIKEVPTRGPGFFLRSHENSPYAWTDSMMSRTHKDTMQVLDKQGLKIVAELSPEPGKVFTHAEFTKDGSHVLTSLSEMKGAIIVYDAKTLREIKRLPMSKPIGKYNVWNKINRSEGTSH